MYKNLGMPLSFAARTNGFPLYILPCFMLPLAPQKEKQCIRFDGSILKTQSAQERPNRQRKVRPGKAEGGGKCKSGRQSTGSCPQFSWTICEVLVAILWWHSIEELQSFSPNSCFQTSYHPCRLLILCFSPESTPGVSMRVNLKQKELHCVKHSWLEAKQVDLVRANTYCYKLMKLKHLRHMLFAKGEKMQVQSRCQ